MQLWQCALWGLFGGVAVEGLEFSAAMRRSGHWPWSKRPTSRGPIIASVIIRLGVGAGVAAAVGASGPLSVLGAVTAGIAAPLFVEKVAQQLPAWASGDASSSPAPDQRGEIDPGRESGITTSPLAEPGTVPAEVPDAR